MARRRIDGPVERHELVPWDDEFLVRRGNYLTEISPELAGRLLERNLNNRRPKERAIRNYARDMAAGKWDPDASDLKFSRTGDLLDGQNRLMACQRAGVPFPTLVRTGIATHTRAHVDTGVKRTVADMLKMELNVGKNPATVGAAVTLRVRYEDRIANYRGKRSTNVSGGGRVNQLIVLTHDEVLQYLNDHPSFLQFHGHAESLRNRVFPAFPGSAILAFLSMAGEIDEKAALQFVDQLQNGEYGGVDNPMPALIQYAAMVRGNTGLGSPGHRGQVLQQSVLLAMVRTWNAMRGGPPLTGRLHIKVTDTLVMPR